MSTRRDRPESVEVALAIAVRGGRLLVARRGDGTHLAGFWEFPGGKIEEGEDPAAAARRELEEETELTGGEVEPLLIHAYDYADRSVRLHAFVVHEPQGDVKVDAGREWRWVPREELSSLGMPEANRPILRALSWRLGR